MKLMEISLRDVAFVVAMAVGALCPAKGLAAEPPSASTASFMSVQAASFPLDEVSVEAVATSDEMHDLSAELASDPTVSTLQKEWPVFLRELNSRLKETAKLVRPSPSLDTLRHLERSLVRMTKTLDGWNRQLTRRAQQLDKKLNHLDQLGQSWSLTLASAQSQDTPPSVLQNIQTSIFSVRDARAAVEARRVVIIGLQNQMAEADRRVDAALDVVEQARSQLLARLLNRDSPSLWNAPAEERSGPGWVAEARSSLETQLRGLAAYAQREQGRFLLHALWVLLLLVALHRMRPGVEALGAAEPDLVTSTRIFASPTSMALVLSILTAHWIYPQSPRLWWAVLGAIALIPATRMLRRIINPDLFPFLNALVILYLADQLRLVAAALPLLSRSLLAAELFGGMIFLLYQSRHPRVRRAGFWMLLGIFSLAFVANLLGYVSLALLLGDAVLGSAYAAVLLYALVRIVEVLVMAALHCRPLTLLSAVRKNQLLIWQRASRVLRWAAWALWALGTLERLALRAPAIEWAGKILATPLSVGSISITLGNLLAFGLTVWAAFLFSRFVRFLLEEDVYPRFHLATGLPYAISTMLHYLILLAGFLTAAAALGLDMTKFTILAGAFGVGLGFGMQTIVNNFISGVILLFERPIKVGDEIQVDDAEGEVETIGIRATTIRTASGSRVIVPNGILLSNRVTNWTGSARERTIELQVAVGYSANPGEVIALLEREASAHPMISKNPPPQALLAKFGSGALTFELHAWTDHPDKRAKIRSELTVSINAALAKAKIPVQ